MESSNMSDEVEKMVQDVLGQFEPIIRKLVVDTSAVFQEQLFQALNERIPVDRRPKRRGRPPGSKNKAGAKEAKPNGAPKRGPGRPRKTESGGKKRTISEAHRQKLAENLRKAREQKQKNFAAVERANSARSKAMKDSWAKRKAEDESPAEVEAAS
jgi:hypothetical protein